MTTSPGAGDPIDLVPFGRRAWWSGRTPGEIAAHPWMEDDETRWMARSDGEDAPHLGIEWDEPVDIVEAAIRPADPAAFAAAFPRIEWWQHAWPTPHRDDVRGAQRGWTARDDPWHGTWRTASVATDSEADDGWVRFRFHPLDLPEIDDPARLDRAEDHLPRFRRTLKIRIAFDRPTMITGFRALADGAWRETDLELAWSPDTAACPVEGPIRLRVTRGRLLLPADAAVASSSDPIVRARARVLETGRRDPLAMATSLAWEDAAGRGTAIIPGEAVEEGGVWVPAYGFLARPIAAGSADASEPVATTVARLREGRPPTFYDRVADEPEQTFDRAFAETPRLAPAMQHPPVGRYLPLGLEGARAVFAVRFNGNVFVSKQRSLARGRDAVGCLWPASEMSIRFGTGAPVDWREREGPARQRWDDPAAPVLATEWEDRGFGWTETAFATDLDGDPPPLLGGTGDEDVVLLARFDVVRRAIDRGRAVLSILVDPVEEMVFGNGVLSAVGRYVRRDRRQSERYRDCIDGGPFPEEFRYELEPYDTPRPRLGVAAGRGRWRLAGAAYGDRPADGACRLVYEVDLDPGEIDRVDVEIRYRTVPRGAEDGPPPGRLEFDRCRDRVVDWWTDAAAGTMELRTGDRRIDDLFRAAPVHVMITADRDPGSGGYTTPAATFDYGACGNEACLQIRQLDLRGYHAVAEAYLDGLLRMQGAARPDGAFESAEGWLQGVDFYDGRALNPAFGYNLDHGSILSCAAEHYLLTRDRTWLERVAPALVAGCGFVERERRATMIEDADGERSPAWGLLPPGHLEDNPEWRHWFAVNAHAYGGLVFCARALGEIGHGDAERIATEAGAYGADIVEAARRARVESPAARLRDGASVPHLPARTHLRGPDWGWFREGAYGPLHLVDADLVDPALPEAEWMLRWLEDGVFPDRDLGRPVDPDRGWFSRAGVTIQPNLLNNAMAHLRGGRIERAVRALCNTLALSLYPDVACFTEHAVVEPGRGTGPYYKTPDECGFLNGLRAFFVHEEGEELRLGWGIPRCLLPVGADIAARNAATRFGPVSVEIQVFEDRSVVRIDPPTRNPPAAVLLRIRRADRRPIAVARIEQTGATLAVAADGETVAVPVGLSSPCRIVAIAGLSSAAGPGVV